MVFEVAYDPCQNIKIANTIEKYPVLYDMGKYPPVEFKSQIDLAWDEVAKQLDVSEGYVKGRWTNIRVCFKRFLRTKAKIKSTKDYYLAPYLKFMMPFINLSSRKRKPVCHEPIEGGESNIDVIDISKEVELQLVNSSGEEESFIISTASPVADNTFSDGNDRNPDWDFLLSLLPDVKRMNAEQKAKFRNSTLTAVDMILYDENDLF